MGFLIEGKVIMSAFVESIGKVDVGFSRKKEAVIIVHLHFCSYGDFFPKLGVRLL